LTVFFFGVVLLAAFFTIFSRLTGFFLLDDFFFVVVLDADFLLTLFFFVAFFLLDFEVFLATAELRDGDADLLRTGDSSSAGPQMDAEVYRCREFPATRSAPLENHTAIRRNHIPVSLIAIDIQLTGTQPASILGIG
jgi:hypothetical protein